MRPATPAAALVCPMLALTLLSAAGLASGAASRRAEDSASISVASPNAVPVPCPSK